MELPTETTAMLSPPERDTWRVSQPSAFAQFSFPLQRVELQDLALAHSIFFWEMSILFFTAFPLISFLP